jgi:hypothetical protein
MPNSDAKGYRDIAVVRVNPRMKKYDHHILLTITQQRKIELMAVSY